MKLRSIIGSALTMALMSAPNLVPAQTILSGTAGAELQRPDPLSDPLSSPGAVTREEYASRRAALAAAMDDGVFVAFGATGPALDYLPYAQEANFRYLTGVLEPEAALVMVKSGGSVEEMLFVRARNPARELWEGSRLGVDGALERTGIPTSTNDRLIPMLERLVAEHGTLYTLTPFVPLGFGDLTLTREQQIVQRVARGRTDTRVNTLMEPLQRLRARKSSAELDMIRRAVEISALAHREAIRSVQPGMNEFEIHALVEYYFRRHGAERPAYGSIVGSGPNSSTLHYRDADRFMHEGEVLLMDVGASYRGYAADITRTVPVGQKFTPEQRDLYEIVLAAQKIAESTIRIGDRWAEANRAAESAIAEGLARLGLIDSPDATYACESPQNGNRCPQVRLFYMHSLGHGVGLEVHDPDVSYFESFQVGSAFTLEPGVYVRSDVFDHLRPTQDNLEMAARLRPAVQKYRDTGIRIEDVYIVTDRGLDRVSASLPREVAEIEALRAEPGLGQENRRPDVVDWYRSTHPR